jgi:hypothetical protein
MRFCKFVAYVGFAFMFVMAALSDDRTLRVSLQSVTGSPTSAAVVGVTAGSATNQDVSSISFYVEYSDDLTCWKPLHSFDLSGTNTEPTIASCLTLGQTALLVDEHGSQHRFYRAVAVQ